MVQVVITRSEILQALKSALESDPEVLAMWEGGAAAFGRVDDWSDIDLLVDVKDDAVEKTARIIEQTLQTLSPIQIKYEVPQPTWHGQWQTFYRLEGTSEFLLLDILVMQQSNPNKFIQPEIHGIPLVHFDRIGVTQSHPLEVEDLVSHLHDRVDSLLVTFDLFQSQTLKEIHRHNHIEALAFYQGFTLRPLVEILRIRYCPARYNFHTRYVYYDLPMDVIDRLEELFFIASPSDLELKHSSANKYFYDTANQIDFEEIKRHLVKENEKSN